VTRRLVKRGPTLCGLSNRPDSPASVMKGGRRRRVSNARIPGPETRWDVSNAWIHHEKGVCGTPNFNCKNRRVPHRKGGGSQGRPLLRYPHPTDLKSIQRLKLSSPKGSEQRGGETSTREVMSGRQGATEEDKDGSNPKRQGLTGRYSSPSRSKIWGSEGQGLL